MRLHARFTVLLLALAGCNREFNHVMDPRAPGYGGDSLSVDADGNGRSDFLDEYAPDCRGPACLDSARSNRQKGIARHPRILGFTPGADISIHDTLHVKMAAIGYYPIEGFLWDRGGDGTFHDTLKGLDLAFVFPDSGGKSIRLRA